MSIIIDTCGLSCPQPVLMVLHAIKNADASFGADHALEVLVDNDCSRENVTRAAQNRGYTVEVSPTDSEGLTRLGLWKQGQKQGQSQRQKQS